MANGVKTTGPAPAQILASGSRQVATLHHLACTGGTVISKALAAMPSVYLVSEIHPYRVAPFQFEPQASLAQFQAQYGALTSDRLDQGFLAQIEILADQAQADGRTLVLRDHSHSDFNTIAPIPAPIVRPLLARAGWKLASAATIRDPVESYMSLRVNGWTEGLGFDVYCERWLQFTAAYQDVPIFRYEQFAEEPDEVVADLCRILGIHFDASYPSRIGLRLLTGDSGRADGVIAPRPFKMPDTLLAAEAARSTAYAQIQDEWPMYRRSFGPSSIGHDASLRNAFKPTPSETFVTAASTAMRNSLINADFSTWERGARFRIKGWCWSYIADRWRVYLNGAEASCVASMREQPRPFDRGMPPSKRYARLAFTPAADTTSCQLYQPIEGPDLFADETVSLTVWLRSNKKVEAAAGFWRSFGGGGSEGQSMGNDAFQPLSSKWTRHEWRIQTPPLPKGVVVGKDARLEFTLVFRLSEGAAVDVTCAQAEPGGAPTPFERRTPALETLLCRRYFRRSLTRLDCGELASEMRERPVELGSGPYTYDAEFDVFSI